MKATTIREHVMAQNMWPEICAMSGDQRVEEQIWPHMKRNRQRFDVHILGKGCVSLLAKYIRETHKKKQLNDSNISAGLLVEKKTQWGVGLV